MAEAEAGVLGRRFVVPPFTVLDARQGYWAQRKKAWMALGIKSEVGRSDEVLIAGNLAYVGFYNKKRTYEKTHGPIDSNDFRKILEEGKEIEAKKQGVSIFDPVLCELAYRWFSPKGGIILDPFSGGSVRGIVAAKLGRKYVGIDLRPEQVESNKHQTKEISSRIQPMWIEGDSRNVTSLIETPEAKGYIGTERTKAHKIQTTPVEERDGIWFKRDDLFEVAGVRGGKVRTCWSLAQGAEGLVTAGSRKSPQVNIVAHIARELGIPFRAHVPEGELSPELQAAKESGAEIIQHKAGYNNVIIARAREDAEEIGWTEIPFGMECEEAVKQTMMQVINIPNDVKRIVMPVGSGMSLSGVLHGLKYFGKNIPVVGIVVGADPTKRLNQYAPSNWKEMVQLVKSDKDYHEEVEDNVFKGITLDPIYESKCIPYVEPGDLFWIVGIRQTATKEGEKTTLETIEHTQETQETQELFDMIFTCPPYADLEVYSDDPRDLSTMKYEEFIEVYREIIKESVKHLKEDRFAGIVVGDVRDQDGIYRNFVSDTIQAFIDAGMKYYNEAIFITPLSNLPIRASKQFDRLRKLAKGHQNVLIFVKGSVRAATEAVR